MGFFDLVKRAALVALGQADGTSISQLVVDGDNALWVRVSGGSATVGKVDQGAKGTSSTDDAWYAQIVDAAGAALSAAIAADVPGSALLIGGKDGSGKLRALALGSAYQLLGLPASIGRLAAGASTSVALSTEDAADLADILAGQTDGTQIANATARTSVVSTAPEASRVLKATSGTHHSTMVRLEPDAPTDVYYVWFWKGSATLPGDGATSSSWLHTPWTIDHVDGIEDDPIVFDDGPGGVAFATGAGIALSTTRLTLTIAGAYLLVDGAVL